MFVRKSTYDKLLAEKLALRWALDEQAGKWNELVRLINSKGGQQFLDGTLPTQKQTQFTQEEIATLIRLCHPDRHDGKESAVKITQKLLTMRK